MLRAVILLAGLVATVAAALTAGPQDQARWHLLALLGLAWGLFAAAVVAVRRVPVRAAVPLVVVGALVLQVVALSFPPRSTDDYHRYTWDGRVQSAGVDPYRYTPLDPALAPLRDDWLFPPACRAERPPCTRINRPAVPTIYPPVAQAEFTLVHLLTRPLGPDGGGARTWQVTAALLALATLAALLVVLRRRPGADPRDAVLWGWCPTVALECGNAGHVDVLAALLVLACVAAAGSGRRAAAGAALGAAVATKVLPLLLLPALLAPLPGVRAGRVAWRRWAAAHVALALGAAGVMALVYLPHVLAVGPRVVGFLPAYLDQEGYDGHSRFSLLRPWLPDRAAVVVGLVLLAAAALAVARGGDPRRPEAGGVVMVGLALAVAGVTYPWYALLLVVLVALDGAWEWLGVAAVAYPGYLAVSLGLPFSATQRAGYGAALLLVAVVHLRRRRARGAVDRSDREAGHAHLQWRGAERRAGRARPS